MGDYRAHIESALQHARHLVPSLEHLAAVDALDHQAFENDLVPIDGRFAGRNAEHGDAAAVVHGAQHLAQRGGIARHFEADVETFLHTQIAHGVVQGFTRHIERFGCAHFSGQSQPIVVHVRDDDVPRAAMPGNRHRHDADGAGAGDQHILADDVERQRRVRGVAERIENGCNFVVNGGRQFEHVGRRNGQIFGECPGAVHAHARGVAAQMPPAGPAIAAVPAGDVAFSRYAIAGAEAAHFAAQLDDFPGVFMADGHGHGDGFLRPGIPVVYVHVGAADRRAVHLDEHVVVSDGGFRYVLQPDTGFRACLDQCFHNVL